MKFILIVTILLVYLTDIDPQTENIPRCFTKEYQDILKQKYHDYEFNLLRLEGDIKEKLLLDELDSHTIIIPVVVHIVWNIEEENIPDAQVLSQIEELNVQYQFLNVQFYLTGITRSETSVTLFDRYSQAMKFPPTGIAAWSTDQYLNIWVCDYEVLGVAQMPNYPGTIGPYDPETDGVVIDYMAFGNVGSLYPRYSLGKTCVHEVGHWFALRHIWGDTDKCNETDDFVDDTYPCIRAYYSSYPSCYNFPAGYTCGEYPRMVENFMDYSDDGCMTSFTTGQKNRMRAAIEVARPTFYDAAIFVDQKLSDQISTGQVGRWTLDYFSQTQVPYLVKNPSTTETLRASEQIITNEKYSFWKVGELDNPDVTNHHIFPIDVFSLDVGYVANFLPVYPQVFIQNNYENSDFNPLNDVVQFKDPWLIDYPDPQYEGINRNRGMKETGPDALIFKNRPSPFYPDYNTSYNGDTYKGVFLNQGWPNWNPPYYSVQTTSSQTISINGRNHTFYFQNWTKNNTDYQDSNALGTGVVFKSQNSFASAVFKGTELTNNAAAFQNNGQRKIITDHYNGGQMYKVYESLNQVWLERSIDYGTTWEIINNIGQGRPLNSGMISKNPSIDVISDYSYSETFIFIVYQEKYNDNYRIKLDCFNVSDLQLQFSEIIYTSSNNYIFNSNPVISLSKYQYGISIMDMWSESSGLLCRAGFFEPEDLRWLDISTVPGTSSISINPSIDSYFPMEDWAYYNFVYEENNTIKYKKVKIYRDYQNYYYYNTENVSYGCGYPYNYNPVITVTNEETEGVPRIAWISALYPEEGEYAAMYRARSTVIHNNWSSPVYSYPCGDMVNTTGVSINRTYVLSSPEFVLAWAEMDGYNNNYVTNYDLGDINRLTNGGKHIQLDRGYTLNWNGINLCTIKNSASPYYLQTTNITYSGKLENTDNLSTSGGRKGVLVKGVAEFYFEIGNLLLNGSPVGFSLADDSLGNLNLSELNQFLTTNPFSIKNDDIMEFSITLGVKDSLSAFNSLTPGDFITAGVRLIDKTTGLTIGSYHQYTVRRNAILKKNSLAFRVNLNNVGEKEAELRLDLSTNMLPYCILEEVITDHNTLGKMNIKELNTECSEIVKEYALLQNYPNPFNPSTVINYEIPKDGLVTIKIYDMLGKEITTLVNEYKSTGRYQTEFDGSNLASGIYIYRIQAGEYTASKKMTLIK